MMTLITGGSKCGKSSFAENMLSGFQGNKYYIATMEPYGEEAYRAIQRHREMRRGKGFWTIECAHNIDTLKIPNAESKCCILLECLTTLCANEMFGPSGITDPSDKLMLGLESLNKQSDEFVVITNEVAADGLIYPAETMEYIRVMSSINRVAAGLADRVVECVCGIPILLKGAL